MNKSKFIRINPLDNVGVSLIVLEKGVSLQIEDRLISIKTEIPVGHKFSIDTIKQNEDVIKYGYSIGRATEDISPGEHVHSHNLKTKLSDNLQYSYNPLTSSFEIPKSDLRVNAYLRSNGNMGIRNELWIIPTVGCVNGQAQAIVNRVKKELDVSHIDDVRVYTHNYGCSQLGDDHENTKKILAAICTHPNAGGVLVLSLGCENNQQADFKKVMGEWDTNRVRFLISQDVEDEIEVGFTLMKELVENMRKDYREPLPLSKLKIGLKCGGSDGFSGITANPLLGYFSDWLIAQGGTTILTEVPEMFGSESILMNRARNKQVFKDIVALINNFKDYFRKYEQPIYENPSPGNKIGGITTLEEKSLGCTQKGGKSEVVDVLDYAETVSKHGLNLLNAPGNDLVATTALGASGCQLVLFTTGRGTPFGSFIPTLKLSTNTLLAKQKPHWIDFDAGTLLSNESMEEMLQRFIHYVVAVINGKKINSEKNDFRDIAIFKTGVTL